MNPPGIRAWLPRTDGPKRRYEAPTCVRDRSKVWADTITVFQARHMLATMIDPKHIVSGWMPRRVHVTDDDGNVVREMTAEQLGAKLIARGAVEFAIDGEMLPSTVCPRCGQRKANKSAATCSSCFRGTGKKGVCACGGRKGAHATMCKPCFLMKKREKRVCPACGSPKMAAARQCTSCAGNDRVAIDVDKAAAAYARGESLVRVAEMFGTSKTTIAKAFRDGGVIMRAAGFQKRASAQKPARVAVSTSR